MDSPTLLVEFDTEEAARAALPARERLRAEGTLAGLAAGALCAASAARSPRAATEAGEEHQAAEEGE